MPPAVLAWLDYSEADQRRAREIVALFSQRESRDELGLGRIRDALSDTLFPGTSVLLTRARYLLFVPWLFREGGAPRLPWPAARFVGRRAGTASHRRAARGRRSRGVDRLVPCASCGQWTDRGRSQRRPCAPPCGGRGSPAPWFRDFAFLQVRGHFCNWPYSCTPPAHRNGPADLHFGGNDGQGHRIAASPVPLPPGLAVGPASAMATRSYPPCDRLRGDRSDRAERGAPLLF